MGLEVIQKQAYLDTMVMQLHIESQYDINN